MHGSLETEDETCKFFCSELRGMILNVDYRLAPEHPFPAAHDDVFEVLNWVCGTVFLARSSCLMLMFMHQVVANAAEYSVDTRKIGLWGCSAGSNLAAGVALRDSENNPSRIAYMSLVVPPVCHPRYFPEGQVSLLHGKSEAEIAVLAPLLGVWGTHISMAMLFMPDARPVQTNMQPEM